MMVFVDGENLVCRYQDMLSQGWQHKHFDPGIMETLIHIKDVLVWHPRFTALASEFKTPILRATYYTSAQGDEDYLDQLRDKVKEIPFEAPSYGNNYPTNLTPLVVQRKANKRQSKGVDISLTVDVLSHVYRNNIDAVCLLSGDGDYAPLAEEVIRNGKQLYLAAFSSGLNPELRRRADAFMELDGLVFRGKPENSDK